MAAERASNKNAVGCRLCTENKKTKAKRSMYTTVGVRGVSGKAGEAVAAAHSSGQE